MINFKVCAVGVPQGNKGRENEAMRFADVTVPVSPVVTTVPVTLGRVLVLSAVGSTTVSVVSKPSAVAPSKTIGLLNRTSVPVTVITSVTLFPRVTLLAPNSTNPMLVASTFR